MASDALVPIVQSMLRMMPAVLQGFEILIFFMVALFYGGVAVRGIRGGPRLLRYPLILLSGLACILAASVLEPFILIDLGPLQFLQPAFLIAGLASAAVLAFAFSLLTSGLGQDRLEKLREDVLTLRTMLVERNVLKRISEREARSKAIEATSAAPVSCKLVQDAWHVTLEKGKRKGILVVMDALTGEVSEVFWHRSALLHFLLSDRRRLAGLFVVLALAAMIAVGFRGVPKFTGPFEAMGLTPGMFQSLADEGDQFTNATKSCMTSEQFFTMMQAGQRSSYSSASLKSVFEREGGGNVTSMFLVAANGSSAVAAFMADNRLCYSQNGVFCSCQQVQVR